MMHLATARGIIVTDTLPDSLVEALVDYDRLRAAHGYEGAELVATGANGDLGRLIVGLRCLSFRSVCRIATRHSHVCPTYVRQHFSTLTSLMGLFWWNDGGSSVRERILRRAWQKGAPALTICARQRRLEREAHELGRDGCLRSAAELGLNMSCADEFECGAPKGRFTVTVRIAKNKGPREKQRDQERQRRRIADFRASDGRPPPLSHQQPNEDSK